MGNPQKTFKWNEFNFTKELNRSRIDEIFKIAQTHSVHKILVPTSVTSRESPNINGISTLTVTGETIRSELPWLFELYEGQFYECGRSCISEELFLATNDMPAVNLHIQKGIDMRYECHVDSNPLQGVFYITSHSNGDGGELVVSNQASSVGVSEIDKDCVVTHPLKGKLLLFDGRHNPHYVRPLTDSSAIRVAVTMNYYTNSSPESNRPDDLDDHLF